jgi:hypothetical protein
VSGLEACRGGTEGGDPECQIEELKFFCASRAWGCCANATVPACKRATDGRS